MISRWLKWTVISLAVLTAVLSTAAFFADEPLRRYAERSANEAVEGYSFQIGTLDLHPLALSVDLRDVVVRQEAHPDPPLASIPEIALDAQLAPLLAGKVSAKVHLNDPV